MTIYKIERTPKVFVFGEKIQTRGNDEDFPTFVLADRTMLGVDKKRVVEEEHECGPTDDETECACGCTADDYRCITWLYFYFKREQMPAEHTCCKMNHLVLPINQGSQNGN